MSIYKTAFGFHIDLSKIIAISDITFPSTGDGYFLIDLQLRDAPKMVNPRMDYFERRGSWRDLNDADYWKNMPTNEATIKGHAELLAAWHQYVTSLL